MYVYICTHMCIYLILELKPMGLGFRIFGHAHQFDGSIPGNSLLISGAVLGEILPNCQGPWLMIRPGPIPGETMFLVARNRYMYEAFLFRRSKIVRGTSHQMGIVVTLCRNRLSSTEENHSTLDESRWLIIILSTTLQLWITHIVGFIDLPIFWGT
jgi:hypothetical protein